MPPTPDNSRPTLPSNLTPPGTTPANNVNYAATPTMPKPKSGDKKRLLILAVIIVAAVAVLLVVLSKSIGNKPTTPTTNANDNQSQGPQPATSLSIQQTSNSISQDISSLHDDQDFPPDALKDASLSL